jgi:hexosaminidase
VVGSDRHDADWQGFEKDDLDVLFDLGSPTTFDSVRITFLENTGLWIFFPVRVSLSGSADGKTFAELVHQTPSDYRGSGGAVKRTYMGLGHGAKIRYLRVHAVNRGVCPPGHPGAGGKAWLFADEVVVE